MRRRLLEILNNSEDVEYEKIKKRIDRPEDVLEEAVNNLLSDGTAYEPKPGSIQKL